MKINFKKCWIPPREATPAALLCLGIGLAIFIGVAARRPEYLRDYRLSTNPDALHYIRLGRNLLLHGCFSRSDRPPFVADVLRTPVYPVFAGGLEILGRAAAIYLAQVALHVGSCLLLFLLARQVLDRRAAFWASLLLGTDLMMAVANYEAMSEMLFVFLVLAALICLIPMPGPAEGLDRAICRMLAGGALLGLATLTRPVGIYLLGVYLAGCIVIGSRRGHSSAMLRNAAVVSAAMLLLVVPWIARNAALFSVPRLTTVDTNNLIYFVGAGPYQLRHRMTLEEAQEAISHEFVIPPYHVVQNPWRADRSVAEMDAALRRIAPSVLGKYPADLVLSTLLGTVKASLSHNVNQLAALLGEHWKAPETRSLLRLRPEALGRLRANGLVLSIAFTWQVFHSVTALVAALLGIFLVLRKPVTRPVGLVLLAMLAYFYMTIGLFGLEAYCRCRIPALPLLYLFAGVGLAHLGASRRAMRAIPRAACPTE